MVGKNIRKIIFLGFLCIPGHSASIHHGFWHGLRILAPYQGKGWGRGSKRTGHIEGMYIVTQLRDTAFGLCGKSHYWGKLEARRQKPPKEPETKDNELAKLTSKTQDWNQKSECNWASLCQHPEGALVSTLRSRTHFSLLWRSSLESILYTWL